MEFPEIGVNCDHPHCKQLEFLPLTCKCNKLFCHPHFNEHIEICDTTTATNVARDTKRITGMYKCSFAGCKSSSIVPLICDKCRTHFCVEHRHINECEPADPNILIKAKEKILAPIQQYNEVKSLIDRELEKKLVNAKKKQKTAETANKVQLMRIKNKATGLKAIPISDRVYFNVKYPSSIAQKTVPVFVSKIWSIGRAIDALAQELKIPNNNNQINSLKLRVFHACDGRIVETAMSENVEALIKGNSIMDGQSIILEYVANDCANIEI